MKEDTVLSFTQKDVDRFNSKLSKGEEYRCWNWTASQNGGGYGAFYLRHLRIAAHRFAYLIVHGKIDADKVVDHICRNRACCNPHHLRLLSNKENILIGVGPTAVNARKTHCLRGHPLSGENLYTLPNGDRVCRTCVRTNRLRTFPPKTTRTYPNRKRPEKRVSRVGEK